MSSSARALIRPLYFLLALTLIASVCPRPVLAETPAPTPTSTARAIQSRPTKTLTPAPTATPPLPVTLPELLAAGDEARLNSDFGRAEAAYLAALELDAKSAAGHAGLGRVYAVQMGRRKAALEEAQQAVRLDPAYAPGWIVQSEILAVSYQPEEALASAEQAVKLADTAEAQAALARAYSLNYQYDEALAAVEAALTLDPESAVTFASLGMIHWDRHDMGRAILATERAVDLQPNFVYWRLQLGDLYAQTGGTALSAAEYDRITRMIPDYGYAQIGKAWRDVDNGDNANAVARLNKLRDAHPDSVEPRRALADITRYTQGSEKAIARYQDALRQDSSDFDAKLGLARSLYETGDCARAETELKTIQKQHPANVAVLELFSLVRWCLNDTAGALKYAQQVTKLDPRFPGGYSRTGELQYAAGQTDAAIEAYLAALRLGYRDGQEHYAFGQMFYGAGDFDRAEQEYAWAATMWPNWAYPAYALCTIYMEQDRPAEAAEACRAGYELDPGNPDLAFQYAWMLLRRGQPLDALNVLTDLPDTSAANTQLLFGTTHYLMGRYPAAIEAFNRFMKLNRGDEPEIQAVVDAMKEGYQLTHVKARALAAEGAPAAVGRPVTVGYEDQVGRTGLVVEITGQPGEKPENIVVAALKALMYLGQVAPRMTPVVNGAHVRASTSDGETIFAAFAGVGLLREQLTGLVTTDQFLSRVEYEPLDSGPAAWNETAVTELGSRAEEVRELKAVKPVPFEAITQAKLETQLTDRTDEDIAALEQDEAVLRLLGLIEPGADLTKLLTGAQATALLGYYDPVKQAFVYVSDKSPSAVEELTIIHEYVHALQDQHFTLSLPTTQVDDDRRLAYRALVEGDAQLAESLYAEDALGFGDQLAASASTSTTRLNEKKLAEIPAVIRETLQFPYDAGLAFASALYQDGGLEALNNAFAAPPRSTEQVLHMDKYLSQEQPLSVKAPALPADLKATWRVADSNVLGELNWRLAVQTRLGPMAGISAGMGWGGDRYTLFQRNDAPGPSAKPVYMLAAVTRWDTEADAQEFAELYAFSVFNTQGVTETTADLLSSQPIRTYKDRSYHTAVSLNGKQVALVVGPDEAAVLTVIEGVK